MSIRDVGRFDSVRDGQPQCIDQDMTLASFHPFVPVESADSAAFGRLYRLAIHNDNGWTLRPTLLCPCLLVERCLDAAPHARILPLSEVVIHGAPAWKFTGNQAPLAPGPQQVKDSVEYRAKIRRASSSARACWWQQRRYKGPCSIAKIR